MLRVNVAAAVVSGVTLLAGCPGPKRPVTPPPPRLVVLLIVDQLPQWSFIEKRPQLTGGFDRLLREGDWHTGRHPTPATLTSPGHALLGSGEPPAHSGILANEWWDRESERMVRSIEDPAGGSSAVRMRVPGLGDAVAAAHTGAKAVAVSLKERAAILTLGHHGTPIFYDRKAVAFASTQRLAWLDAYNRAHPIAAHLHDVWTPLDPARLARLSGVADDQPGETGAKTFGPTFPHDLAATKDPADAVFAVPLGNELVFATALAAIDGEHLGADATPDLLILSLSAHDYAGHGWGHESWESWDMTLRLDRQLADFLAALDTKIGANRWAMIVTSDHGASRLPERVDGGRITPEMLIDAANRAAIAELGPGDWIAAVKYPTLWLTAAARAQPDRERGIAIKKIMFALRSFPGITQVGKSTDFAGHCETRTGDAFAICMMLDPERSGEVFFLPKPGWIFHDADEPTAAAHGSFQDYDRDVPVIMVPSDRPAPHLPLTAPSSTTIEMVRISTVIANWLGVTPPLSLPR
ncbi:MAG: alkaline phosphatase family protein [Kofleriaceae bacterium]